MLLADLSVGKEVFYFEILKCSIFIILWDRGVRPRPQGLAPVGAGLFALQKDWRFAQDEGFQFHAVVLFCKVRHGWGERNVISRFFTTWRLRWDC